MPKWVKRVLGTSSRSPLRSGGACPRGAGRSFSSAGSDQPDTNSFKLEMRNSFSTRNVSNCSILRVFFPQCPKVSECLSEMSFLSPLLTESSEEIPRTRLATSDLVYVPLLLWPHQHLTFLCPFFFFHQLQRKTEVHDSPLNSSICFSRVAAKRIIIPLVRKLYSTCEVLDVLWL